MCVHYGLRERAVLVLALLDSGDEAAAILNVILPAGKREP